MAIATVADFRDYLVDVKADVPPATTWDTLITKILERAESIVTLFVGFEFAAYGAASARVVETYGQRSLILPPHQAGSVTAVTLDGVAITDYTVDADGSLYRLYGWGVRVRYSITAVWGIGPAPAAILEVVLEVAVNIWRSKDRGMWQEILGEAGAGGIRFVGGLTKQQQTIIEAVREKYGDAVSI